jgi:hypothetical protein
VGKRVLVRRSLGEGGGEGERHFGHQPSTPNHQLFLSGLKRPQAAQTPSDIPYSALRIPHSEMREINHLRRNVLRLLGPHAPRLQIQLSKNPSLRSATKNRKSQIKIPGASSCPTTTNAKDHIPNLRFVKLAGRIPANCQAAHSWLLN